MLNGYRQIFPARTHPADNPTDMPTWLQIGRMDVLAAMEEEYNDWYNTCYIPGFLKVPGVIRARRFVAVEAQPKYLTVYEFERPDVPASPEWKAARESSPWSRRVHPAMRLDEGSPGIYERIFPKL